MIRKLIYSAALILLLSAGSQAQTPFKQEVCIGGSFGMGFSSVGFTPKVKQNMLQTYHAGITGRWISDKNVGLQLEVNFNQQGWDEEFEDPAYHYKRTINYIEIPFLTHIYAGNRRVRFVMNLGPKVGYAFSESTSENLEGASPAPNTTVAQRASGIDQKFDWGICGGPGLEIRTGIGNFVVEGRYYYALGNIYSIRRGADFAKASNQQILIKLTYLTKLFSW
ncbi:MAG: PorT family protein [Tannerellaceae bacterium]|nr:PorT family protein [Tannerellaceae bacterium]